MVREGSGSSRRTGSLADRQGAFAARRYAVRMRLFLDSLWRAAGYCLLPRVIALSLLPLVLMVALALGLGYFYWDGAVASVRAWLESSDLMRPFWSLLESIGIPGLRSLAAPLLVIFATTPLIVLGTLLLVAAFMTPALTALVAERRFPGLERRRGASLLASIGWSLASTGLALLALAVSLPLWLIPPLILLLPPLIWGWLTYRVMAFDVLAGFASRDERREIFREHRLWLLGIGVVAGFLGAAPSIVWASGALFAAAFALLAPVAIWIYTLVFAFASLWFAHYCLAALAQSRAAPPADTAAPLPLALADDASPPSA